MQALGLDVEHGVGVDGHELNTLHTGGNHTVHGVATATAHANDLDYRHIVVGGVALSVHPDLHSLCKL